MIGEIREEFFEAHARTGTALDRGDTSSLDDFAKANKDATTSVVRLAHALGIRTYGEEAYSRHKDMFGATLGWNTASE